MLRVVKNLTKILIVYFYEKKFEVQTNGEVLFYFFFYKRFRLFRLI